MWYFFLLYSQPILRYIRKCSFLILIQSLQGVYTFLGAGMFYIILYYFFYESFIHHEGLYLWVAFSYIIQHSISISIYIAPVVYVRCIFYERYIVQKSCNGKSMSPNTNASFDFWKAEICGSPLPTVAAKDTVVPALGR